MNAVQIIGAGLAIWCVGSFAIGAIYAFLMWRYNARAWSTHRDRQHRDRIKHKQQTLNDLPNGESFGGVEKTVHGGLSK